MVLQQPTTHQIRGFNYQGELFRIRSAWLAELEGLDKEPCPLSLVAIPFCQFSVRATDLRSRVRVVATRLVLSDHLVSSKLLSFVYTLR